MIRYTRLLLIILGFGIFSCNDDEIVRPDQPAADSTSTSAASQQPQADPETAPAANDSSTYDSSRYIGPDTAYYQIERSGEMPYRIMVPRKYDPEKKYPLLLFLHGIDERGNDNEKQLKWGSDLFQSDNATHRFPSFVVFPQCPTDHYWFDQSPMENLRRIIQTLSGEYSIDKSRIYIVGLSMGAYGTYAMVADNPDLFAAAVAISGDGDARKAPSMTRPKWRIFGGDKDTIVSSEKSEKMAKALKDSGASVEIKIYPEANHLGSWTKAFEEPDFISWIYAQHKSNAGF